MKAHGIWKILPLWAIGLLFLSNVPSPENKMVIQTPANKTVRVDKTVAPPAVDTVIIKGMVFIPEELHVRKGDIVVWLNKDIVPHNITDFPDNQWTSGTLAVKGSWKKQIDQTFDYYCSIHPTMKGKITVDP